ncbi:transposase [Parvibaculum sp.]|uniref:transposase n=1 Tax=Parvibaculum sp. TaxID=2024848 RepID=UPI00391912E4
MSYSYRARMPRAGLSDELPGSRSSMQDLLRSDEFCRSLLEAARWPAGPVCTNCGATGEASKLATRPGLWTCRACRRCQFSVTSGTPLHRTRLPVAHWVRLFHLIEVAGTPLTISQVSRRFDVAHLTAENMLKRISELKEKMPGMTTRLKGLLSELPRGPRLYGQSTPDQNIT